MKRIIGLVALALAPGYGAAAAEKTPSPALLVLSKGDHTLAIVNPSTRAVIAKLPSGPDPHEVIASSDGKVAFVSNYGGGAYNTLTVADLANQRALPIIDLGPLRGPHGLVFAGGKVWFTAEGAKVIGSYDPTAQKVDWVLGTGQNRTHMIFVFDDLARIITSNVSSGTISIIEKVSRPAFGPSPGGGPAPGPVAAPGGPPRMDWDETTVPVGESTEGFDVSPDGKEIWAANARQGTVSMVDIASKKVSQTIAADVRGANRLKFTPDGKLALVSCLNAPDVSVIDTASRQIIKRVPVGHGAAGILMNPDGSVAYVACTPDSYVAVIDLKTMQVAGHIDAGKNPDGLAWAVER
jgi:YVTN family beta-propeller protein